MKKYRKSVMSNLDPDTESLAWRFLRKLGAISLFILKGIAMRIVAFIALVLVIGTGVWLYTDMGIVESYLTVAAGIVILVVIGAAAS